MKLQVAMDVAMLDEALALLPQVADYVDIVELGTPLIDHKGTAAVSAIKAAHPEKEVFADMKTADVGELEAGIAFAAGADEAVRPTGKIGVLGLVLPATRGRRARTRRQGPARSSTARRGSSLEPGEGLVVGCIGEPVRVARPAAGIASEPGPRVGGAHHEGSRRPPQRSAHVLRSRFGAAGAAMASRQRACNPISRKFERYSA